MPDIFPISAEITTMVYPTEVEDKVKNIIFSLIKEEKIEMKEEKFTSYYGYSFKVIKISLNKEKATTILRSIICSLKEYEFLGLLEDIDSHIDGRNLYIRLDKQDLASGRIALYDGSPGGYVRVKFTFQKSILAALKDGLVDLRGYECMQT